MAFHDMFIDDTINSQIGNSKKYLKVYTQSDFL